MTGVPRSAPIPIPARRAEDYFVPWRQFSKGSSPAEECCALPRSRPVSREQVDCFLRTVHHRCDYVRLRQRQRRVHFCAEDDCQPEQGPLPGGDIKQSFVQPSTGVRREARKVLETVEKEREKKEEVEMVEIADCEKKEVMEIAEIEVCEKMKEVEIVNIAECKKKEEVEIAECEKEEVEIVETAQIEKKEELEIVGTAEIEKKEGVEVVETAEFEKKEEVTSLKIGECKKEEEEEIAECGKKKEENVTEPAGRYRQQPRVWTAGAEHVGR